MQNYGISIPDEDLMDPTQKKRAQDRQASGVVLGKPPSDASGDKEGGGASKRVLAREPRLTGGL